MGDRLNENVAVMRRHISAKSTVVVAKGQGACQSSLCKAVVHAALLLPCC